ncbi:exopolysaccharide biosynthesis polyprenyl glycosylphosphotransferase [Nocardioides lianchengensis]|uniref:Exopolysaccharide biosynthesis polyprenyl glycosylphosphotransferase n=1 Tax=Nocardioides lianchengensis TaxID=1045774 RepID=A0A1G6WWX2_9ACTN|nr:exopolysaccharide biosynthesis polyprenyl glycosylphosphotransferase [Nocardioides lianchengensis]NYG09172.1 exopolysaccharide biosynthesis polyprenyl glycosylphosphotransferase [Nocardioides lianchengensis]SDD70351.1 exopolysaccharide biosynthesis polyprenyl glycosylphosphotransferase [Nocardioides lianchengensis]
MRAGARDALPLRGIRPLLVLVDPLSVLLAVVVLRPGWSATVVAVGTVAAVLAAAGTGLHRSRLVLSVIEDVPKLAFTAAVAATVLLVAAPSRRLDTSTLLELATTAGVTFVAMVVLRTAVYALAHALRRSGRSSHPVIVVGAGTVGVRLTRTFLARPQHGLRPVGIVDSAPQVDPRDLPVPYLGGLDRLESAMVDLGVHDVVFAFPDQPDAETTDVVRRCLERDHQVFVVPRFFEMMGLDHHRRVEVVGDIALMRLRRWGLRPVTLLLKRLLDVTASGVALVLLAPIMLACALAVRVETGPGVIFRQLRVGRHGRPFQLYKFRSLKPASEAESATAWSIDHDDRLGPVGRFLRRTSLDELPQLVNVLRGDMSLVGPRPERPYFVQEFTAQHERYDDRHRVAAGLTGWAQVNDLRGDTPIEARVRFDNHYIENWSLWTDVKILLRTARTLARPAPGGDRPLVLMPASEAEEDARRTPPTRLGDAVPRVLHVAQPTTEGVADVLLGYVRDQVARGWDVTVACPSSGWLAAAARGAGARVLRWEARRSPGPTVPGEVRRLQRIVDRVDPDVVHLHSAKAGLAGRLAVRGRRTTLFQPHAWSFEAVRGPLRWATIRWERHAQRWTTELVCVSRGEQLVGEQQGIRAGATVAFNGVDVERFHPRGDAARQAARRRLGLPDVPTVLCVGRLTAQKGQGDLLDAWPHVRERVPGALLVLVGDGPDRDELQQRADTLDDVRLVGSRNDVEDWLAAADVVAAPSRWEGMAVAPLEAMAAGRSVVATRTTGMEDSVPPQAGVLVDVGNVRQLADSIIARLVDADRAASEGEAGRAHVESHHDVRASAREVARQTLRHFRNGRGEGDVLVALQPLALTGQVSVDRRPAARFAEVRRVRTD